MYSHRALPYIYIDIFYKVDSFVTLFVYFHCQFDHLTSVARLRMSAHRLAIEMGRHVKPKICKE